LDVYLTTLANLVETVANSPSVKEVDRVGIVHSAGMNEKTRATRQKQVFEAKMGNTIGTVSLIAAGIGRGSHEWRYTEDLSGKTGWQYVNGTVQAATTVTGLQSGKEYAFGHRTILASGPSEWEDHSVSRAK
jgi:hypothetical protein